MLTCDIHSELAAWIKTGGGPAFPPCGLRCSACGLSTRLAAPGCVPWLLLTNRVTTGESTLLWACFLLWIHRRLDWIIPKPLFPWEHYNCLGVNEQWPLFIKPRPLLHRHCLTSSSWWPPHCPRGAVQCIWFTDGKLAQSGRAVYPDHTASEWRRDQPQVNFVAKHLPGRVALPLPGGGGGGGGGGGNQSEKGGRKAMCLG